MWGILGFFNAILDLFDKNIEGSVANLDCQSRICGVFTAQTIDECKPVAMAGSAALEPTGCFSE